jgi:serine/threonine-protein kinase ULK4
VEDENPVSPAPSDDGMVIDQGSGAPLSDGRMISATANDAMMARAAAAAAAHQSSHGGLGAQAPARRGGVGPADSSSSGVTGKMQGRDEVRRSASVISGRAGDTAADSDSGHVAAAGTGPGMDDDLLVETGPLVTDRDAASLEDLVWHPSDTAVKPIVANRRIGKDRALVKLQACKSGRGAWSGWLQMGWDGYEREAATDWRHKCNRTA